MCIRDRGCRAVVERLSVLKSNLDYGMFLPIQKAAIAAITGDQSCVEATRQAYQQRRDVPVSYTHLDVYKRQALYLFTSDKAFTSQVLSSVSFGGGCVNDTIIHLATSRMGFGGVGASGMGQYHGRRSFDAFTHEKSIVKKATWLDLPIRYQPATRRKMRLMRCV